MYFELGYNQMLVRGVESPRIPEYTSPSEKMSNADIFGDIPPNSITYSQTTLNTLVPNEDIQTENFVSGSTGWQIKGNGDAEFNGVIIRGTLKGGQTAYNTGTGFWIGEDTDGVYKFSLGESGGDGITWDGSSLTITGGVSVSSLNIPDATTAESFHVDTTGNAWWGANVATGYAGAPAYVLKDGSAYFSTLTVEDTGISLEDIFGDGSDGDVTLTGDTTLTRDMFYNNLNVAGYTLSTGGYRIFVAGTLSGSGTIKNSGGKGGDGGDATGVGSGATYGAGGIAGTLAPGNSVPPGIAGEPGGNGGNGNTSGGGGTVGSGGDAGVAQAKAISETNAVAGAGGGNGGNGVFTTGTAGGSGGAAGTATGTIYNKIRNSFASYLLGDTVGGFTSFTNNPSSGGSAGGGGGGAGAGAGDDGGSGGGGAGSGASGGVTWISARTITFTGTIEALGGDGGDGGDGYDGESVNAGGGGGGGAGSGGNGGIIIIQTTSISATYSTDVSGGVAGTVGAGGAGVNDGADGSAGNDGNDGKVITLII